MTRKLGNSDNSNNNNDDDDDVGTMTLYHKVRKPPPNEAEQISLSSSSSSSWPNNNDNKDDNSDKKQYNILPKNNNNDNNNNNNNIHLLLAQEMHKLSIQEREEAYEDLHGVTPSVKETPELVQNAMQQFQNELLLLLSKHQQQEIVLKNLKIDNYNNYFNTPYMKQTILLFLRSNKFPTKTKSNDNNNNNNLSQVVSNFLSFLQFKQQLFGTESLSRPLTLQDLGPRAAKGLKAGWLQFLPFRDTAGRAILWKTPAKSYPDITAQDKEKITFYQIMATVEHDIETQQNGLVVITYGLDVETAGTFLKDLYKNAHHFWECMPVRIVAVHFCIPRGTLSSSFLHLLLTTAGSTIKARTRIHPGCNDSEWLYSLLSFGIPVKYAPITQSGERKLKYWHSWITRRKHYEKFCQENNDNNNNNWIEIPNRNDVLSGKGITNQEHSGNLLFNQIVDEYRLQYHQLTPQKKKELIRQILQELLQKHSIRFLERDQGILFWKQISTDSPILLRKISKRLSRSIIVVQEQQEQEQHDHSKKEKNKNKKNNSFLNNDNENAATSSLTSTSTECMGCFFNSIEDGKRQRIVDW